MTLKLVESRDKIAPASPLRKDADPGIPEVEDARKRLAGNIHYIH